mmetsp:Transcript_19833/g.41156  ORF Transcript_19833/g.41156 Transcript_19833/m.41156 type:complete len:126 (-) Transcript_19833:156-533(-)
MTIKQNPGRDVPPFHQIRHTRRQNVQNKHAGIRMVSCGAMGQVQHAKGGAKGGSAQAEASGDPGAADVDVGGETAARGSDFVVAVGRGAVRRVDGYSAGWFGGFLGVAATLGFGRESGFGEIEHE